MNPVRDLRQNNFRGCNKNCGVNLNTFFNIRRISNGVKYELRIMDKFTIFQMKVYNVVKHIPRGKVVIFRN